MLSEIAQEHGVEWDLSAAARTLLPPPPIPSPLFTAAGQPQGNAAGAPGQVRGSGGEEARCVCVCGGGICAGAWGEARCREGMEKLTSEFHVLLMQGR